MKKYYFIYLIYLLGTITPLFSQVTNIPFAGSTLVVKGEVNYLEIRGQGGDNIAIQEYQNSNNLIQHYRQEIEGDVCTITLKHKHGGINLFVPQDLNLNIQLDPTAYEDGPLDLNDFGNINLRDLTGNLEINTDGFHVQFKDINGLSSIVTYGDIQGKFKNRQPGKLINLDTYLGNVYVQISKDYKVDISAKAVKGTSYINDLFLNDQSYPNRLSIHSENGKYINVDTIGIIDVQLITHPELRDQYIELFVKYWGYKLYPEARVKLEKLGYQEMLNEFATDPQQNFNKTALAEELMTLIEKHGVPDYKMVGNEMPFKAIEFLFHHFQIDFIEKYSDELSRVLGRQVVKRGLDRKYRRYRNIAP